MKKRSASHQHPIPSPTMSLNLATIPIPPFFHPLQEGSRLYLSLYLLFYHSPLLCIM